MSDPLAAANAAIAAGSPALDACLSALGRRIILPQDIPFQAAQARDAEINGTIGQITDGHGSAVPLPSMLQSFNGLTNEAINRAVLYSPIDGIPEVRKLWAAWQTRDLESPPDVALPVVTTGLTHGISIVADLFGGEGRTVVVPAPFWGNYRQAFGARTGARVVPTPAFRGYTFNPGAIAEAVADVPAGEPVIAVLNFPSNPAGYSPTVDERAQLRESLVRAAADRPLLVLCDDAYLGLVYEDDIPRSSMFWELLDAHPNLIPVKVDGATKELSFFGGRVGFLTFPFPEGSDIAKALQSKAAGMVRATVGSPVAASQIVVRESLRRDGLAHEVDSVRRLLARRYRILKDALAEVGTALFKPLPFNSGCFALVELADGVDPEAARRYLLREQSTGLIAIKPRYLRMAYCSVDEGSLGEMVRRLAQGLEEMGAAGQAASG